MKIYLASRSARRQELLKQIGIEFELIDIEINEAWDGVELAKHYVKRMAQEKAIAANKIKPADRPVLAADTSVVLNNKVLGKAQTEAQAMSMLQQLSGRTHIVYSAVTLAGYRL
jgi:septum formation protein